MGLSQVSLNTLRAFEASARHLSFTRAAEELCVTQAAVSHQVKALEDHLGAQLFRRTSRGLVLTDEGAMLYPVVASTFSQINRVLETIGGDAPREVLNVGIVGTFAVGFLIERLSAFRTAEPQIDIRIMTNNNKVDLWTEDLDCAIRFGDGNWHGTDAVLLLRAPVAPLCSPMIAEKLSQPGDLGQFPLLRSYRMHDWSAWFAAAGVDAVSAKGMMFDASQLMVQAAVLGQGVALAPPRMFARELASGQLVQPFDTTVDVGAYWLTRLASKPPPPGFDIFARWLIDACGNDGDAR